MRRSQTSDDDKKETVPLSAEKWVAMQYEESEDPTLLHQAYDTATEMLKGKVLQNIGEKFETPEASLCRFFVGQPLWATVHLSKDADNLRRIFQNLEMQKIETVVQAQIGNVKLRDQEFLRLIR